MYADRPEQQVGSTSFPLSTEATVALANASKATGRCLLIKIAVMEFFMDQS